MQVFARLPVCPFAGRALGTGHWVLGAGFWVLVWSIISHPLCKTPENPTSNDRIPFLNTLHFKLDELVKTEISPRRRRERGDKSLILKNSSRRPLRLCGEKKTFYGFIKLYTAIGHRTPPTRFSHLHGPPSLRSPANGQRVAIKAKFAYTALNSILRGKVQ
jgi:hypothetical protein